MNILILGSGVIGCLYGSTFKRLGHHVTHLVRQNKIDALQNGIDLDVLDLSQDRHHFVEKYSPTYITQLSEDDPYDVILISVKHYQIPDVLTIPFPINSQTKILFFSNNWTGLSSIQQRYPSNNLFFGMPRAGGAIQAGKLMGALHKEVILGKSSSPLFGELTQLFKMAGIKATLIDNMEHWYWIHLATTCAWISGGVKAKGFKKFCIFTSAYQRSFACRSRILSYMQSPRCEYSSLRRFKTI